jgi:hypothetical protein
MFEYDAIRCIIGLVTNRTWLAERSQHRSAGRLQSLGTAHPSSIVIIISPPYYQRSKISLAAISSVSTLMCVPFK